MPKTKLRPGDPRWDGVEFGLNLLRARRACGLTQYELAARSGLHRTAIGLLENAYRTPQIDTVLRLAEAVEVDITILLEGTFHG